MIIYSSRRRQVFLYTPLDHLIRWQINGWRFILTNRQGAQYALMTLWFMIVLVGAVVGYGISEGHINP